MPCCSSPGSPAAAETDGLTLRSRLVCPICAHASTQTMPTDACLWFYTCEACGSLLRPAPGDCCVFCSYGDVPCPPRQAAARTPCCARPDAAR